MAMVRRHFRAKYSQRGTQDFEGIVDLYIQHLHRWYKKQTWNGDSQTWTTRTLTLMTELSKQEITRAWAVQA